ncbi:hypothetical protein GARC_4456 [Paraglaciecola arctica BSs20135]|uniref:Uncharacterized protein n=1 Tax=Paraglaciecola arctica BSs20135 TaxID=493475 RepID=K6YXB7_9ALTE|nr:hypothetical protein GARC_4456 [Paraglaciecola arctica BSs20135]
MIELRYVESRKKAVYKHGSFLAFNIVIFLSRGWEWVTGI